jgi:hypothetical protein
VVDAEVEASEDDGEFEGLLLLLLDDEDWVVELVAVDEGGCEADDAELLLDELWLIEPEDGDDAVLLAELWPTELDEEGRLDDETLILDEAGLTALDIEGLLVEALLLADGGDEDTAGTINLPP